MTRFLDSIAHWLRDRLDPESQLRIGVLIVLLTAPAIVYGFFSGEPFFIYQMSAIALTLTGVGIVITAEVLVESKEIGEDVDLICAQCGASVPRKDNTMTEQLETEKGTDAADLPHAFRSHGSDVCEICTRSSEHELHSYEARERAAEHAPVLITEKGS